MKQQLRELYTVKYFSVIINNQRIIGKRINDRIAVCQSYTSNDKNYCAPADFGTEYYFITPLEYDDVLTLKKAGWFNEKFYQTFEDFEHRIKAQAA